MITDIDRLKKDLIIIEDLSRFIVKIPNLHPDNPQYTRIWKNYFKYCIEGLWQFDNGGWRFMPPTLFFYANFFKLQHTEKGSKVRRYIKPLVRDLDWLIHYSYLEAQGFSGFSNDNEFSCDVALTDADLFSEIEQSDKAEYIKRYLNIHRSDGKRKQYTPVREYIKKLHKEDLGKPLYENPARNFMLFGARGGGKSFSIAGISAHHLTFDGAKEYTREALEKPTIAAIAIGAGITDKSSELVSKISDALNRLGLDYDLGVYGNPEDEIYEPNPFYRNWVGDLKPGNKKNPYRYEYEIETPKGWVKKGTNTSMFHINYSDKKQDGTQAGAGGRYLLSVYEEIGLMPNFRDALLSNIGTVSVDGEQFGVQWGIGTSGNIETLHDAMKIFTHPEDYNCLKFRYGEQDQYFSTVSLTPFTEGLNADFLYLSKFISSPS